MTLIEQVELAAFRQIRIKVRDLTDESNNDELAGFVKGVVGLETELYTILTENNICHLGGSHDSSK